MTIPVWCELVCGHCSASLAGRFSMNGKLPLRDIKKIARRMGVIFEHSEVFCDSECLRRFEKEQDNAR